MADEVAWVRAGLFLPYHGREWVPDDNAAAHAKVLDYAATMPGLPRPRRRGLWLSGPPGTGKTHLAMIVADAMLDRRWSVMCFSVPFYLSLHRKLITYSDGVRAGQGGFDKVETLMQGIADAQHRVGLVVLDDLGKEHKTNTRFAEDEIDYLVRSRAMRALPTVVTTNSRPDEMLEHYGENFVSFLRQAFVPVVVNGRDHREDASAGR